MWRTLASFLWAQLAIGHPGHPTPDPLAVARIQSAARYSAERQGLSLIVWQRGKRLLERYDNGAQPTDRNRLASIVKNFWAVTAAIGVDQKWLRYEEKVADTIEEWRDDPVKSLIEVRHLLSMTSGLDPGYAVIDDDNTIDKLQASLTLPSLSDPGTNFAYGPANMAVFGELLRRKLAKRHETMPHFVSQHVLTPLGIKNADWGKDKAGNPLMAAGAFMSARDLLAFGQTILERGRYDGRRVVAVGAMAPLFEKGEMNPMYGLTFWLNKTASSSTAVELDVEQALGIGAGVDWAHGCISRVAPPDLVAMVGSYNQRVYVVPSRELTIVRQGKGSEFRDAEFLALLFGRPDS